MALVCTRFRTVVKGSFLGKNIELIQDGNDSAFVRADPSKAIALKIPATLYAGTSPPWEP